MNHLYETVVDIHGGREGSATSRDGKLKVQLRAPKELGGPQTSEGTNPEQLFAAGYGACFGSALGVVARKKNLDMTRASLVSTSRLFKLEDESYKLGVTLQIKVPGMDVKKVQEIADEAHRICPYSNATRGNIDVTIEVEPA